MKPQLKRNGEANAGAYLVDFSCFFFILEISGSDIRATYNYLSSRHW